MLLNRPHAWYNKYCEATAQHRESHEPPHSAVLACALHGALIVSPALAASKPLANIPLGGAENFGRSYKADNYCETMSNMVLRATYNLLAKAGFHQALQKT